jgi:hypothetical protein
MAMAVTAFVEKAVTHPIFGCQMCGRNGSLDRLCADLGFSPRPERERHAHRSAVGV